MRYCDDFVVLSPTRQRAEQARDWRSRCWDGLGMRLHPDKTGIVCLTEVSRASIFSASTTGRWNRGSGGAGYYLQRWPSAAGDGRDPGQSPRGRPPLRQARPVDHVVADLNPVLRGWGAYFRNGNSGRKFNAVDGYVHERLAIFASAKHGLRAGTGPPDSTTGGSPARGLPPHRNRPHGARRMPDGERCRKAVCGRTACTVRQGAAGDTGQPCGGRWSRAGALRNPPSGPVGTSPQQRSAEPAAYLTIDQAATSASRSIRTRPV